MVSLPNVLGSGHPYMEKSDRSSPCLSKTRTAPITFFQAQAELPMGGLFHRG
jgi:hypothetical protein